jgi:hypothetical protein
VVVRSKAQVCGRLIAGNVSSNHTEGNDIIILCLFCVEQVAASGDELITRLEESLPSVCVCVCVLFVC